jgi:D-lactate dehydrogenase
MYDVVFYEVFSEEGAILRKLLPNGMNVYFTDKTAQEEPLDAKLLSIRTQSIVPSGSNVLSRSTGIDHLKDHGGLKSGLANYASRAVAEQAVMLMMSLFRKLKKQMDHMKNFNRDNLTGVECLGKNVLIVGMGKIGYEINTICKGLGMNIFGVDVYQGFNDINYLDIDEGLSKADVIICAMSLIDNAGYFNYDVLKKAKKGAVFVNISRGELSPIEDVLKVLDEGYLKGAALDVFSNEKELYSLKEEGLFKDVLDRDDVILTPHNAFNTEEALVRKCEFTVGKVVNFLEKGEF